MGGEEEEQLGEKIARPIVAIQTVYFTRNVGTKGLSWKVEIGRRKDRKNFGRPILEEKWNFFLLQLGDLSIWDYIRFKLYFMRNVRVELEG